MPSSISGDSVCSAASTVLLKKRRRLVIVAELHPKKVEEKNQKEVEEKPKKKVNRAFVYELAKSGRSRCKKCKQFIDKGTYRVGLMTFYPHKNIKWFHKDSCSSNILIGTTIDSFWYQKKMSSDEILSLKEHLTHVQEQACIVVPTVFNPICGELDMPRFANALTERYNRFRSFRFGLPENQKYSQNWRWRCFLATMLVCNTHETAMLAFTEKLFTVYKTPEDLDKLRGDKTTIKAWMDHGDKNDLRHSGKKMTFILRANQTLIANHGGDVPNDRETLQKMNGVGRHVASITMAWCHQEPEFGIDVHVKRIMERWGYITSDMSDIQVENKVKEIIPKDKIGHFSRAFVDHGQAVCGYTPNCSECYLKHSCPTASKYMDW